MSRKREGLAELLHWSRRPSTCDQPDRREERPHTAVNDSSPALVPNRPGRPHTSLGLTGRASGTNPVTSPSHLSHTSNSGRCGLPPLSRGGTSDKPAGTGVASDPTPDTLSYFQEALYINGQPHNATSRLLRLGAGAPIPASPLKHGVGSGGGGGGAGGPTMPPITPQTPHSHSRTQSPSASVPPPPLLSGLSATLNGTLAATTSGPLLSVSLMAAAPEPPLASSRPPTQSMQLPLAGHLVPAAWSGLPTPPSGPPGGFSSPPRMVHRFGSREDAALIEEARRMAQQAVEVLYGSDQEVSPADRATAAAALQQLESLLGPREVSMTALAQAVKSLRAELGRELHLSEKQMSFARAQLRALERQHERLRNQLQPRPDPIVPPPSQPSAAAPEQQAVAPISPKPAEGDPPPLPLPLPVGGGLALGRSSSITNLGPLPFSCSAPQSPRGSYPLTARSYTGGLGGVGSSTALSEVSGLIAPAGGGASGGSSSARGSHGDGGPEADGTGASAAPGSAAGDAAGGGANAGGGAVVSSSSVIMNSDRWSLSGAMERTLQLRALSRAEAALQAVAAAHAREERPPSNGGGEGLPLVDVEELRRLKHAPGTADGKADEPPSYLGVNVRRAPSPLSPGADSGGRSGGGSSAGGGCGSADPRATLQWSNRGISTSKMPLLREVLKESPQLVRLCLAGNKLSNEDVAELMSLLSAPDAPRVRDLSLEQNTNLTWRCALPLALALGMSPDLAATAAAADWAAVAAALPSAASAPHSSHAHSSHPHPHSSHPHPSHSSHPHSSSHTHSHSFSAGTSSSPSPATLLAPSGALPSARDKVRRLGLHHLNLCGVKLGDKGVMQLAEGLRANHSLRELDLRRCGVSDAGGAALLDVLGSNGSLQRLELSWNALRGESARVLEGALAGNAGLRELGLAHNGFGDVDGARVVKGLLSHGKWLRVDLSHNTLGPGSCIMVGELMRRLGEVA
ncbi:hypothetical protein Agub_g3267, partial [Astrephomene gubernaculifera]